MLVIVVDRPDGRIRAYVKGDMDKWGCGSTVSEAIGDLVQNIASELQIELEVPVELGTQSAQ